MELGVFGGSFDPPHVGHLLAATDALEKLELDQVLVIPAAQQPLKVGAVVARPDERLEMAELAFGDDPRFLVDPVEIRRAGLSFTVDTLAEMRERFNDARFTLLVGSDVLNSFGQWYEPERILQLARLAVLVRRDQEDARDDATDKALRTFRTRFASWLGEGRDGGGRGVRFVESRRVDVSSTEIRSRVRRGRSIRGFVSDAVARYIETRGLYR